MDAKSLGLLISKLRKQKNLTQSELAKKLNVSNKAISRWESGVGFPEITIFPELSRIFGVTVDYLMTGERNGIAIAGNIITDIVKTIDFYPDTGMLTYITNVNKSVGGCAPNTAINLAKIDRNIPLSVIGKIGDDEYGRYILSQLNRYNINCNNISISSEKHTSFCDVMSLPSGERTFFHNKGANAEFSPDNINISSLNCVILHIGYLLLLDKFDSPDNTYGTVMAKFLHDVQEHGIKTSIDMISNNTADYKTTVIPALKYCNYIIINELESGMISGFSPYKEDGTLDLQNVKKSMEYLANQGVKDKIIVHCKQAGFCYDISTNTFTTVPSLNIPNSEIKGSVGAGDAFCAGALYGIYNKFDDQSMLEFASSSAACNLFSDTSVDGMKTKEEIEKLEQIYGRKEL